MKNPFHLIKNSSFLRKGPSVAPAQPMVQAQKLSVTIKKSEGAKDPESLYHGLLQNIYDAALITDSKGKILGVNVRAIDFLLYQQEEFSQLKIFNIISGADESLLRTILQNLENQTFTHIEGDCVRKDGSFFPAEIVANQLSHTKQSHLVFFVRDITRRKTIEEELRRSESKNRALLNAIPDLMFRVSHDGTLLDFKAVPDHPLGALANGSLGKKVSEVFPKLASQFMTSMKRALETDEAQFFEHQVQKGDLHREYEIRIVVSEEAEVLAIVRDITERKKAEQAEKERIFRDLEIAREIQQHLLPAAFPNIEGFQVSAMNVAALKVGGDYYDIIQVSENHWGFAIADVSGKGVSGALIMAICRSALRSKAEGILSPSQVLKEVNRVIQPDIQEDMFISAIYGILDVRTRQFTFCRAGHEPLLIYRGQSGNEEILSPRGMPLGLMTGKTFDNALEEKKVTLQAGDTIVFYTDGITEALNHAGEEFGRTRLTGSIRSCEKQGAEEITHKIEERIRAFVGDRSQNDDITLMVLKA